MNFLYELRRKINSKIRNKDLLELFKIVLVGIACPLALPVLIDEEEENEILE